MNQPNDNILHIGVHAARDPNRPAVIWANDGKMLSFMELDQHSSRLAQHFRARGIQRGDHIAILMENSPDYLVACCAAQRAGLH